MQNEYKYVLILCEGQSEESFIKSIVAKYLALDGIYVQTVVLGGVSRYSKIRGELKRLGKNKNAILTTMLDYYKLPKDVPGVDNCDKITPTEIAEHIEYCIYQDLIGEISCISFEPYIQMHEYEALLFSDVEEFAKCNGIEKSMIYMLKKQVNQFETPEHVNNSEQTSPSKRILQVFPEYQKVTDGTMVAKSIGIEKMLEKCPHFACWIKKLQSFTLV
jgi:hypothetical protein